MNKTEITIKLRSLAKQATCNKLKTSAIICKDDKIISQGFNDSLLSDNNCLNNGCLVVNNHCKRCIHAEQKAILNAAKQGIQLLDSEIYTLYFPCNDCLKQIISAGIKKIYYINDYEDEVNKLLLKTYLDNNLITIEKLEITEDVLYAEEIDKDLEEQYINK